MRLTLRTLLAYLDDVLEPAHAREIGDKINESALATQLVAKIRDVIRRRRLGAPSVDGPGSGIDANTVAEYLDNLASPEAIVDVEKVCLDSDVSLAEVAACHQILTLVQSEPVEVANSTRDRMYGLGPIPGAKALAGSVSLLASPTGPEDEPAPAPVTLSDPSPRTLASAHRPAPVPEYLRPEARPTWKAFIPAGVVILVAAFWLWGILAFLNNSTPTASTSTSNTIASTEAPKPQEIDELPEVPPPSAPEASIPGEAETVMPDMTGIDDAPPPDLPEEAPKATQPEPEPEPAPAKPAVPAVEKTPEPVPEEKPPVRPAIPVSIATYDSREGVVLILLPENQHWYPLDKRVRIETGDVLAVPAPFEGIFNFDERRGRATALENSLVRALGPNDAAEWGWSIDRGRMIVQTSAGGEQRKFGLEVRGELWGLELLTDDTVIGIDIDPREPQQFEEDLSGAPYFGTIFCESGELRIVDAEKKETLLKSGTFYRLNEATPDPTAPPTWIVESVRSKIMRGYAKQFEKELIGPDPASAPAVDQLVGAVVKDTRPLMSKYAVECLGLIGAIDQLIDALKSGDHEEARVTAIHWLREWLPARPENRERMLLELQKKFTPEDAAVVYQLLWGYSVDDLKDDAVCQRLTTWLEHDQIAIRELASHYIVTLTGKRWYDYRPNATPGQRQEAIRRIRAHLARSPFIAPSPAPPAAPATPGGVE